MDSTRMVILLLSCDVITCGLICCFHSLIGETELCHVPLYSKAAFGLLWLLVYVVLCSLVYFVLMKLSMSSSDEKDDLDFNSCQQKDVQKALEFWGSVEENPTNKQLSFVAKEMAVDKAYVYLAGQLGISWSDIKIIEIGHQGDVKRISLETLVKWMELKATEATVYALLKGLLSIDRHDFIVKFDKQFRNN